MMENKKTKSVFLMMAEDGRSFKAYNEAAFLKKFCNPSQQIPTKANNLGKSKGAWAELGIPSIFLETKKGYNNYYGEVK